MQMQIYRTKSTRLILPNQIANPNLQNQIYQTKHAIPKETYLTKHTKPSVPSLPNQTHQNKPNQTKRTKPIYMTQKQLILRKHAIFGSFVPLAMFLAVQDAWLPIVYLRG